MRADVIISSPPFHDSLQSGAVESKIALQEAMVRDGKGHKGKAGASVGHDYGSTPGQLGALRAGDTPEGSMTDTIDSTLWDGCYDDNWKGIISEASFAHPAKYARALIRRIYAHLIDTGRVRAGDTVVDPFGGVGLGALDALANDLHWYGVELEAKFHTLGCANLDRWREQFGTHTRGTARLLNGDSRNLVALLEPVLAECCISSPPFLATEGGCKGPVNGWQGMDRPSGSIDERQAASGKIGYGTTPGQLGVLPAGDVGAVISSPPFTGIVATGDPNWLTPGEQGKRNPSKSNQADYGHTPGNIANLPAGDVGAVISSPPYAESIDPRSEKDREADRAHRARIGRNPESAGSLPMDDYGTTPGNIGNDSGDTFWQAARVIIEQSFALLRPGGCAAWVLKAFVRAKQIVDFPGDWRRLCEACGFVTVEVIHASLVKRSTEASLFGGEETKRKEKKSFFRRNHESKVAAAMWLDQQTAEVQDALTARAVKLKPEARPKRLREIAAKLGWKKAGKPFMNTGQQIDHEVVLIMVKPGGEDGRADCVVSSPPFCDNLESKDEQFNAVAPPGRTIQRADYGSTAGQLGAMPPGSIEDALTPEERPMIEHMTPAEFNRAALLAMSEAELQRWVIARARFHGWRVIHLRPARTNKGWRTAVQGDGAGFPDTLILRGKRLIAAELKRVGGKLTDLQDQWLNAFADTGAESYLWTPADLDDIEQVLTRRS